MERVPILSTLSQVTYSNTLCSTTLWLTSPLFWSFLAVGHTSVLTQPLFELNPHSGGEQVPYISLDEFLASDNEEIKTTTNNQGKSSFKTDVYICNSFISCIVLYVSFLEFEFLKVNNRKIQIFANFAGRQERNLSLF